MPTEPQTASGVTSFKWYPNQTFRYVLTVTADAMELWVQDRKSKCQW